MENLIVTLFISMTLLVIVGGLFGGIWILFNFSMGQIAVGAFILALLFLVLTFIAALINAYRKKKEGSK